MAHDYLGHNYYHRPSPFVGDASEEGALVHDERAADPARERGEVAEEQARRPPRALSSRRAPRVEASAARPPFKRTLWAEGSDGWTWLASVTRKTSPVYSDGLYSYGLYSYGRAATGGSGS